MSTGNILQPFWDIILNNFGGLISHWFFPMLFNECIYLLGGLYFLMLDFGPLKSDSTRLHKNDKLCLNDIITKAGIQFAVYTIFVLFMWYVFPFHLEIPLDAPTLSEFSTDLILVLLIGDLLFYVEHILNHKTSFLYKNFHYVHHSFKEDMFAWCAGWVHPIEGFTYSLSMCFIPVVLYKIHPLTHWAYITVLVMLILEEHCGHDVWWSPNHVIPKIFGGAVPHDVHHLKSNANFGFILTIWDRMFGTYIEAPKEKNT